jgi:ketosteroid isomerase-like protein
MLAVSILLAASAPTHAEQADRPTRELRSVETAFAATMTRRDLDGFAGFLDDETVFFAGPTELRGKEAVVDAWSGFFEGDEPPFSWQPEVVSVLDSGNLGLTSGPVLDPEGNRVGTFNSIWRKNAEGEWKIVFDRGCG